MRELERVYYTESVLCNVVIHAAALAFVTYSCITSCRGKRGGGSLSDFPIFLITFEISNR